MIIYHVILQKLCYLNYMFFINQFLLKITKKSRYLIFFKINQNLNFKVKIDLKMLDVIFLNLCFFEEFQVFEIYLFLEISKNLRFLNIEFFKVNFTIDYFINNLNFY